MKVREPAAKLTAEGLRILVMAAAVIGGGRLVPAEASAPRQVVDLKPVQDDIAQLRREIGADLRDHDRRLLALERKP